MLEAADERPNREVISSAPIRQTEDTEKAGGPETTKGTDFGHTVAVERKETQLSSKISSIFLKLKERVEQASSAPLQNLVGKVIRSLVKGARGAATRIRQQYEQIHQGYTSEWKEQCESLTATFDEIKKSTDSLTTRLQNLKTLKSKLSKLRDEKLTEKEGADLNRLNTLVSIHEESINAQLKKSFEKQFDEIVNSNESSSSKFQKLTTLKGGLSKLEKEVYAKEGTSPGWVKTLKIRTNDLLQRPI